MKKTILSFAVLSAIFLSSCKEETKQDDIIVETETVETTDEDIVTTTTKNKDGKEIEITFNNTAGTATVNYEGETVELQQEKSASGFWYKNDTYELIGKGNNVDFSKDGEVIFSHADEIITTEYANDAGDTLHLEVNSADNSAKAYLNGGDQIDLEGQKAASGTWYKNDQYELRGKGEKLELKKDGEVIFKN
ncbi:MliC family protein [Weeksellaceae bacterium KMM 9724]|uniref:MliC family protein n=1 Tax=Profundicola chukchiensis TaxID=2961959 RepID=UPI00243A5AC4|nr:MliC family protein [Profundicola chukchiensis]MDG4950613.1 MliC family protein [Profundicola chukchiensis]